MVSRDIVGGAQTHCTLFQSVYDLKAPLLNAQRSQIREFKQSYNTVKQQNNSCMKGEGAIHYSTETRWFVSFQSD